MSYNTKQREILLDFFNKNHDKSFSAKEIASMLDGMNISVSAVYRNLSELEKNGKVRKTSKNGSRDAYYQYVDCEDCKGHLHLSCTKCGSTTHLDDNQTKILLDVVASNANFNIDKNSTVLYGLCKKCCNIK